MCNRHELPPLIEHEVSGIVSKRIKRRDLPLDNADPIDLDPITEGIFTGLRNALLITALLVIICWGLFNMFELYQNSKEIFALGDWSKP